MSRKSIGQSFGSHYADSLLTVDFARVHLGDRKVFDLGTGAGFPGLIFAIRYPSIAITLFEKSLKKQTFLSASVAQLQLPHVRVEGTFPEDKLHGLFFARAVFPTDKLFHFFKTRLIPGSRLVINLGGKAEALKVPKAFSLIAQHTYTLPLDLGNRRVEIYEFVPRGT